MKHDFIDKYSSLDSVIHHLDPRVKLLLGFCFLILIALTRNFKLLAVYGAVLTVLLGMSRVPLSFYLKRLLLITPLVVVFSLFIYLSSRFRDTIDLSVDSLSRYSPVWEAMGMTALKIYISILVITLLVSTTRFNDLLWSLRRFRMPLVITILSKLVYTYIFIFIDELHRTLRAYKSRTPVRRVSRVKVYGNIAAGILLRSMDRSDYIYRAMISRGFDGEFPEGNVHRCKAQDALAVILFLLLLAAASMLWNL
jgi:cobalt/nickel transport system permease protein